MHPRSRGRRTTSDQMATSVSTSMTKAKNWEENEIAKLVETIEYPLLQSLWRKHDWATACLLAHWEVKSSGRVMCSVVGILGIIMDKGRWDTASSFGPRSHKNQV